MITHDDAKDHKKPLGVDDAGQVEDRIVVAHQRP